MADEKPLTPQQRKIEEFKKKTGLNIPVPFDKNMTQVIHQQSVTKFANVRNPGALSRIEEIKRGYARGEMSAFVGKEGVSKVPSNTPVPVGKREAPGQRPSAQPAGNAEPVAGFDAAPIADSELSMAMRMLESDAPAARPAGRPSNPNAPVSKQQLLNNYNPAGATNDTGAAFENKLVSKMKFASNSSERQHFNNLTPPPYDYRQEQQPVMEHSMIQSGMMFLNEEDLKKKILAIASQIVKSEIQTVHTNMKSEAEKLIRNVMQEYAKQKGVIVESDKVKKAEVLGENIVRIEGKTYRLQPVTIKKKSDV